MLNRRIAELLGWKTEAREIGHWSYLGDGPYCLMMEHTFWYDTSGKEYFTLPNWSGNEALAHGLLKELTREQRREWGKLYMGIGYLAKDEPHSVTVCKAWVALKEVK